MKKFMVKILIDIDLELGAQLQPSEDSTVGHWLKDGILQSMYYLTEGTELFAVMQAESEERLREHLQTLAFYPYMTLNIWQVK